MKFEPVLIDMTAQPCPLVDWIGFVSGNLYYDLAKAHAEHCLTNNVAIVQVEELCPFQFGGIGAVMRRYGATNQSQHCVGSGASARDSMLFGRLLVYRTSAYLLRFRNLS